MLKMLVSGGHIANLTNVFTSLNWFVEVSRKGLQAMHIQRVPLITMKISATHYCS